MVPSGPTPRLGPSDGPGPDTSGAQGGEVPVAPVPPKEELSVDSVNAVVRLMYDLFPD